MPPVVIFSFFYAILGCQLENKAVPPVDEKPYSIPEVECLDALSYQGEETAWSQIQSSQLEDLQINFDLTIDMTHVAWEREGFQSIEAPVTISGVPEGWEIVAAVKELRAIPELIRLDIYISSLDTGLHNIELNLFDDSGSEVHDYRIDPWAQSTDERVFFQNRIVKEGFGHFAFGLEDEEDLQLSFILQAETDNRESRSSSPIVIDPVNEVLWSTFHDTVTSISLSTGHQQNYSIPGKPSSVMTSSDGRYALTVSPQCNQVVVIDTESEKVVQILDEDTGIGREPREIVASQDGRYAYVSSYVGDTITVVERTSLGFVVVDSIPVGRRPTGMSLSPDDEYLYVSHFLPRGPISDNESWISVIHLDTGEIVREVSLRDQFNYDRAGCVQQIEIFSSWSAEELSIEGVPKMLAGVFLDPSGQMGLVPGLKSPGFPALEGDVSSWGVGQTRKGANNPAVLYPISFLRDPLGEVLPWQLAQDVIDTSEEFLQCASPTNDIEFVTPREAGVLGEEREELFFYPGTITPGAHTPFMPMGYISSLGYTKGGRRILALSSVADMVAVLDGMTHQSASKNHFTLSGSNPIGIAVSQDGMTGYVAYRNSPYISVLDLSAYAEELPRPLFTPFWLQDTSQVAVSPATRQTLTRDMNFIAENPLIEEVSQYVIVQNDEMDPIIRRGKILFESSNPEKYPGLSGHPHASCFSCHPNGGSDGSAWGTVEGERRTNSLRGGIAGRGWLHYSATHSNIDEFLDVVLPERLGGSGLDASDHYALSLYVAYGIPSIQSPETDAEMVEQGRILFENNCLSCHAGETFSSGNPAPDNIFGGANHDREPIIYNIGTQTDRAGVILGPPFAAIFPEPAGSILRLLSGDRTLGDEDIVEDILKFEPRPNRNAGMFKAPSLTNVWDESLFLHNGQFSDLPSVIEYKSDFFSLELSIEERDALFEYLKTL